MKPDYLISNGIDGENKRFLMNIKPYKWGHAALAKRFRKFKIAMKILQSIKRSDCPSAKMVIVKARQSCNSEGPFYRERQGSFRRGGYYYFPFLHR
jgi:hypothetical protein